MQMPLLLNRIPTTEEVLQSTEDINKQSLLLRDRNLALLFKIFSAINIFGAFLIVLNTFLDIVEGNPINPSSGWRLLFVIVTIQGGIFYTNRYMTSLFAISEAIDKAKAETEAESTIQDAEE